MAEFSNSVKNTLARVGTRLAIAAVIIPAGMWLAGMIAPSAAAAIVATAFIGASVAVYSGALHADSPQELHQQFFPEKKPAPVQTETEEEFTPDHGLAAPMPQQISRQYP